MSTSAVEAPSMRLRSLDAYRGFVMLAMASGGLGLVKVAKQFPESRLWENLAYQFDHVEWRGCSFWDLIQPSFMFMVGVAMPFSYAARRAQGQSWWRMFGHAIWRSLVLIALGVFLESQGTPRTHFHFVNVLTQIGLGYVVVFLLLGRPVAVQFGAAVLILLGYWAWFASAPLPPQGLSTDSLGGLSLAARPRGFAAHWDKNTNPAALFDRTLLNAFLRPHGKPFVFNAGGYTTLNFVPSIATMLFGVLAGQWLRSARTGREKTIGLLLAGAVCLMIGTMLDESYCPVVKRIWTPSWTVYSTAWTCGMLAAFYGVIDVAGWRRWAFPLVVVGVNSIAMYVMAQLLKGWIGRQIQVHVGTLFRWLRDRFDAPLDPNIFGGTYGPIVESVSVLFVLWLICFWMYRRKIFLKI